MNRRWISSESNEMSKKNHKTPAGRTDWTDGQTTRQTDGQTYNTPNMIYDLSKTRKKNETEIMIISFRIEEALYTEKNMCIFLSFIRSVFEECNRSPPPFQMRCNIQ